MTAERAPEAPWGLEWVVMAGRTNGGRGRPYPHPAGPVGRPCRPPWDMPLECPPGANRARFDLISYKVS